MTNRIHWPERYVFPKPTQPLEPVANARVHLGLVDDTSIDDYVVSLYLASQRRIGDYLRYLIDGPASGADAPQIAVFFDRFYDRMALPGYEVDPEDVVLKRDGAIVNIDTAVLTSFAEYVLLDFLPGMIPPPPQQGRYRIIAEYPCSRVETTSPIYPSLLELIRLDVGRLFARRGQGGPVPELEDDIKTALDGMRAI